MKIAAAVLGLVTIVIVTVPVITVAQPRAYLPRVGFLSSSFPSVMVSRIDHFRQGLHDLGYVEGENIVIEYRFSEGKLDRLRDFATELVRLNVKAIVTAGPRPTRTAKEATVTIPIVMAFDNDPVRNRFVVSLARPGGNITGLSALAPELSGKRLELLKEIVPSLSRLAVLGTSNFPGNAQAVKEIELVARSFGIKLQYLDVLDTKDIETAFQAAKKAHAEALLVLSSPFVFPNRTQIVELINKNRLAAMHNVQEIVEEGGLMAYGPSHADLYRRSATYVDKILKGAKPAELPVEQPTRFELVINLKAAEQIGLMIPPTVVARAHKVIW